MLALKHIHHKKRLQISKKYTIGILDHFMYIIALTGPIMTIPQIYDIWVTKTSSINLLTWGSYLVIGFIWLFYGVVHREKPIIFSNTLGIITTGLVVLGAAIHL